MRKNYETSDLFALIHKSKKPLSADQIAKAAKSLRHKVAPFLKLMVSNGQLLEVRNDNDAASKFIVNPQTADAADLLAKAPVKPAGRVSTAKSAAKSKAGAAKPSSRTKTATKASTQATPSNVHQLRPAEAQATAAVPPAALAPVAVEDKRMEILRLLAIQPMMKSDIAQKLGDVEEVLKALKAEGLVTDSYIISDYTWELTDEAYIKYPELSNPMPLEPAPKAAEEPTSVASTDQVSLNLEVPGNAPVATPKAQNPAAKKPASTKAAATETKATAPAAAPAPAPAPAVAPEPAPAPAAASASAPALAPSEATTHAPAGELSPLSEISMTVASVVERMLQDRFGDLTAQLEAKNKQIAENQKMMTEVAADITECTDAFQVAIGALNKLAQKLSKLS